MSHPSRPQAKPVAELIGPAIDPLVRKRGLARAELVSWWPEIVGPAYAGRTVPERIRWPRDGRAAILVIRCDPALALQISYETDRIRERLNTYLGFAAVGAVKIVQHRIGRDEVLPVPVPEPDPAALARLDAATAGCDAPLAASLRALGRQILDRRAAESRPSARPLSRPLSGS